ncbi:MAG: hypothetical protein ACJ715_10005, partial [Ornithinibacter sp.]
VVPDALHELTQRDLLEENADLMAAAGLLLAQRQPRLLRFTSTPAGTGRRKVSVTTDSVASVDIYVNGRPVATTGTSDGNTQVTIPAAADDLIRIEGYDEAGMLVAASQQRV